MEIEFSTKIELDSTQTPRPIWLVSLIDNGKYIFQNLYVFQAYRKLMLMQLPDLAKKCMEK